MARIKTATVVGIPDLEKEFGLEGRVIRQVLRKAGMKAPKTGIEGFGPRARYEWTEGSKELEQVRSILKEFFISKGDARRTRTKQDVDPEEDMEPEEDVEDDD